VVYGTVGRQQAEKYEGNCRKGRYAGRRVEPERRRGRCRQHSRTGVCGRQAGSTAEVAEAEGRKRRQAGVQAETE